MEDEIAVHCKNKEDWDEIVDGFKKEKSLYLWKSYRGESCLDIKKEEHCSKSYYERNGYTIISASEYLNEGGKDVSEFKRGDRVECVDPDGDLTSLQNGYIYTIRDISGRSMYLHGIKGCSFTERYLKLATKTQTTKENNMELNSSIRTVLVEENGATFETVEKFQKVFGSEIAENFTGAMILRKNIKTYNDEIKRLEDIEAKRLEKEEKESK